MHSQRESTIVDSMRISIHALRCHFLCLQGTHSKWIRSREASGKLAFSLVLTPYLLNAVVYGKSPFVIHAVVALKL